MASLHKKSSAGRHIHHDDSMDVRFSNAATLAVIDTAAPLLNLEPDTVYHGSTVDIPLGHDSHEIKSHHQGIKKAMSKVKNVIKEPFNAKHKTEPRRYYGICQSSSSVPADPDAIMTPPLANVNAPCSSTNSIETDEEVITTKPKARIFSRTTKKVAKKAGPALLALAIGIAEHYLNNAGF
ncbi:hypothetical protein BDV97DRAFT_369677 [Delphinella strobiligena]|nr:hypothetical protein BDV97DRAFT_369677 [Delphinella strobiligena]